jgi:hypothetical protein
MEYDQGGKEIEFNNKEYFGVIGNGVSGGNQRSQGAVARIFPITQLLAQHWRHWSTQASCWVLWESAVTLPVGITLLLGT